ncbi:MAG: alanine--tRNA ligase, partial [Victivallaceae bacterium]
IWHQLGIPEERIAKCGKKDNWWGPAGLTGPCGPDTEMFYWTGKGDAPEVFDPENKLWVEIWNDVFMQYNKKADGAYEALSQKNVDTGMGLERVAAVLQGKASCYDTELFQPLFGKLDEIRGIDVPAKRVDSERIIADHIRAAVFISADGIAPGNVDQAYVLRRLIRRIIREANKIGIDKPFVTELAQVIIDGYQDPYSELAANANRIKEEFELEEKQFAETLVKGTREFEKLIAKVPAHVQKKVISGKNAFFLYETYGFPLELTEDMARENGFEVDREGFDKAYQKHQEMSRKGAEQKFKGGLADASEQTADLHTATHLLQQALRQILGEHVQQRGSNITAERLRFDFSHDDKVSREDLDKAETIVNDIIKQDLPIVCREMTVDDARKEGAIGLFEDRYGNKVKVYSIGDFSKEICGGPHAPNTGRLGRFKIKKEESSSRGVRRIKAVLIK